jgi:hypothetical protein
VQVPLLEVAQALLLVGEMRFVVGRPAGRQAVNDAGDYVWWRWALLVSLYFIQTFQVNDEAGPVDGGRYGFQSAACRRLIALPGFYVWRT